MVVPRNVQGKRSEVILFGGTGEAMFPVFMELQ